MSTSTSKQSSNNNPNNKSTRRRNREVSSKETNFVNFKGKKLGMEGVQGVKQQDKMNKLMEGKIQPKDFEPKYITRAADDRFDDQLTSLNKKSNELLTDLKNVYLKLRVLTEDEENTAAKFSQTGKRLEMKRKELNKTLGRVPTDDEWSSACQMSTEQLHTCVNLGIQARNRLVQHNIRIVDHWARRLIQNSKAGKDVSYYELVAEGLIGLTKAAECYQAGRVRFYTHAEIYVRSELYKGLTKLRAGSHTPHSTMMMNAKLQKAQNYLTYTLKRKPTDEELSVFLKMKLDTVKAVQRESKIRVSSPDFIRQGSDQNGENRLNNYFDIGEKAFSEGTTASDDFLWKIEFNAALLDELTATERRTLSIRYGLMDGLPRSVETTAQLMAESTEMTRQRLIKILEKLRKNPRASEMFKDGIQNADAKTGYQPDGVGMNFVHAY